MGIGELIKAKRWELGMTQNELGGLLGQDETTIASYEEGRLDLLTIPIRNKLAFILNIPIASFVENLEVPYEAETSDNISNERSVFTLNLRWLMDVTGKSKKEVSDALNVSYFTFVDWYDGKKYPRDEYLQIIANYFGITITELLDSNLSDNINILLPSSTYEATTALTKVFARRLKLALDHFGLKLIDFSRATGIYKGVIGSYLKEKDIPKQETFHKMAQVLNVSERWLLGYGADDEIEVYINSTDKPANQERTEEILSIVHRLHEDTEFMEIVNVLNSLDAEKLSTVKHFLNTFNKSLLPSSCTTKG